MSDKIVEFKKPDTQEHTEEVNLVGIRRCLSCKHEWQSRVPLGTVWADCPACGLLMGRAVGPVDVEGDWRWHCKCGNELFALTPDGATCIQCGEVSAYSDVSGRR